MRGPTSPAVAYQISLLDFFRFLGDWQLGEVPLGGVPVEEVPIREVPVEENTSWGKCKSKLKKNI